MDPIISKEIEEKIKKMIDKGDLRNKEVILSPVNLYTYGLITLLRNNGINPLFVLDNNVNIAGEKINGVPIGGALLLKSYHNRIVLISSQHAKEIKTQLIENKIPESEIEITAGFNKASSFLPQVFFEFSGISDEGKKVYEKVKGNYEKVLLFPYNSVGDILILGMYKYWLDLHYNNYVIVLTGGTCRKIAEWFGFDTEIITESENVELIKFAKKVNESIEILHYHFRDKTTWDGSDCWKDYHFIEMYKRIIFENNYPDFQKALDVINGIKIISNKISQRKKIVLSPYAKSIINFSPIFWEKLANELLIKGYDVYTNCAAALEYEIKDTKRLELSFEELLGFLKGNVFIGIRSGLCDLVSFITDKKIILYPGEYEKNLFSLQYMGMLDGITEIVVNDYEKAIKKIMEDF